MKREKIINLNDLLKIKDHLEKHYGIKITSSKNASEIEAIATILDALGIKNKDDFMRHVSITIHKRVYLNFEVGSLLVPALKQIEIMAHEIEHVLQWDHEGPVAFSYNYLTKPEKRAEYETKALSADLEMHYRITGNLYKVGELSDHMRWYKIKSKDVKVAEKHLAILANILKQGGQYSEPVKEIIKFL